MPTSYLFLRHSPVGGRRPETSQGLKIPTCRVNLLAQGLAAPQQQPLFHRVSWAPGAWGVGSEQSKCKSPPSRSFHPLPGASLFPQCLAFSVTIILLVCHYLDVFPSSATTQMWYLLQGPALPRRSSLRSHPRDNPLSLQALGLLCSNLRKEFLCNCSPLVPLR